MITTENDELGSGFKSLIEKATPKTELYEQMQQTSDNGRSEEELQEEVTQEMIERAENTDAPEHKDTKLTGYMSN